MDGDRASFAIAKTPDNIIMATAAATTTTTTTSTTTTSNVSSKPHLMVDTSPVVFVGPMEHHSNLLCWREFL